MIGLGGLIFAFAAVEEVVLLPAMVSVTAAYYLTARLPLAFLVQRLRYPGLFLVGLVLLLPFLSGQMILWRWGPLTLRQEGCLAALLISCRFLTIFTLGLILLATTPFLTLVKALRSLGLPRTLADMTLLSYRYLDEIADNLAAMRLAMQLRGFGQQRGWNWRHLSRLAALTGTLLIRSYEQSEQVYRAMRLRGYGYEPPSSPVAVRLSFNRRWWSGHGMALLVTLAIAMGFIIATICF